MAESTLTTVRTFMSIFEAEVAQSALDAAGIDSLLRKDDCGGLRPHMQMTEGVELLVREEDAEEADAVLTAQGPPEGGPDGS